MISFPPDAPSMRPPPLPIARFLRFCAIGALSAAGAFAMFWALMSLAHLPYLPAYVLTFCIVNVWGYLASRRAAFTESTVALPGGLARYLAVAAAMLALNSAALRGMVDGLGWHPLPSSLLLAAVGAPVNFLLHGRITFRMREKSAPVSPSRQDGRPAVAAARGSRRG